MNPRSCLIGIAGLALASCSAFRSHADSCLTCDEGVTASSTRATKSTAFKHWNGESIPICGGTGDLFQGLGPDEFVHALHTLPSVIEDN